MQTLVALGDILVKSIPTFILVWILFFYISRIFLNPLHKTLHQRRESTEGLRKAAEERIGQAEQKTAEYQQALQAHSADIYRQQEQDHQRALERRTEILRQARQSAEEQIGRARQEIQQQVEEAKKVLQKESEQMAQWITRTILEPPTGGSSLTAGRGSVSGLDR